MLSKAERKRQKFARQFHSEAFVEFTRFSPCVVDDCPFSAVECAHNPSRAAGGTWEDVSPLCTWHHGEQHSSGVKTFQWRHGIRFTDTNAAHAAKWRELCG